MYVCVPGVRTQEFKAHPFYADMDWAGLMSKTVRPSFVPDTKGDADTSFFDEVFTSEKVCSAL